jgi:3-carboxy-cis,cis-muconate cycloisomerase
MVSELFGPTVTTGALMAATGDAAWLAALLEAEAALASASAAVGIVPAGAADAIGAACRPEAFDVAAIGRDARGGGNPVIPLVAALRAAVAEDHRGWVHWGATSQDVMDTAASLVASRAAALVAGHLIELGDACAELADTHRATLMVGRTLLQPALPITLGLKAAGWLSGVDAAAAALDAARDALCAQLGGAAGTLASLGERGPAVVERFAAALGLGAAPLPWHTARQRTAGLAGALGVVAGTAAKISGDVALLAQAEVGEAREPAAPGRGGSSTLPQKRNPVGAAAVGAAARQALALVPVLQGALIAEHERPVGAWQAEWAPLSDLLALAGGAAARTAETVAGLEVDAGAMAANLAAAGGALLGERVVLEVGRGGDRARVREAVAAAAGSPAGSPAAGGSPAPAGSPAAGSGGRAFADALAERLVPGDVSAAELDSLLDPAGYLGSTDVWIDRALAHHRASGRSSAP